MMARPGLRAIVHSVTCYYRDIYSEVLIMLEKEFGHMSGPDESRGREQNTSGVGISPITQFGHLSENEAVDWSTKDVQEGRATSIPSGHFKPEDFPVLSRYEVENEQEWVGTSGAEGPIAEALSDW
jgi:hypothetical protein